MQVRCNGTVYSLPEIFTFFVFCYRLSFKLKAKGLNANNTKH